MMKIGRCASVLSDAEKRIGTDLIQDTFPIQARGQAVWRLSLISVKSLLTETMM